MEDSAGWCPICRNSEDGVILGVHAASPRQARHSVREFLQTTAAGPSRDAETRHGRRRRASRGAHPGAALRSWSCPCYEWISV